MIVGDFLQEVWIQGQAFNVRDLSIDRGRSQRTMISKFRTDDEIESNLSLLSIGADFQARVTIDGEAKDFFGDVAFVDYTRGDNFTEVRVEVYGREARLQRRRFTGRWLGLTAKAIIDDAFSRFGAGLGLTFSPGPDTGPEIVEIAIQEGTLYDVFEKVCKIADWAWRVDDEEVQTWNPQTEPKGRAISQAGFDIVRGTVQYREDARNVQNAIRGVAYEVTTQSRAKWIRAGACVTAITFPRRSSPWELVEFEAEFQGEEVSGELDLQGGTFKLGSPLLAPAPGGYLSVTATIRRPVVLELRDDASIAEYGLRYAPTYTDDGGLSFDAVEQIMQAHLDRMSQPSVTLQLEATRWPFEPETRADVTLYDPAIGETMVIESVKYTNDDRLDATIALELVTQETRRAEMEPDPTLVMAERIERLENRGFHPDSPIGNMLANVGLLSFDEVSDVWQHADSFETGLALTWSDGTTGEWSDDTEIEWSAG